MLRKRLTRISQWDLRRILVAGPSSQRRDDHKTHWSHSTEHATPEDGGFLVHGPSQVPDRRTPESLWDARHLYFWCTSSIGLGQEENENEADRECEEVRGARQGPLTRRRAQVAEEEGSSISGSCLLRGSLDADRLAFTQTDRGQDFRVRVSVLLTQIVWPLVVYRSIRYCLLGLLAIEARCLRSLDWA